MFLVFNCFLNIDRSVVLNERNISDNRKICNTYLFLKNIGDFFSNLCRKLFII
jgi:hypothetical protein